MSNYIEHAKNEFIAAGWMTPEGKFHDEMQQMICEHVMKLLDVFAGDGHSGSSAPYAINLFSKLAAFKPLAPLTGEDWEWNDISEYSEKTLYQNKRLSSVFKDENGAYDNNGRVFWEWYNSEEFGLNKSYYTNRDSSVKVKFPYTPPENPEYVFVPTEEYPNEVI